MRAVIFYMEPEWLTGCDCFHYRRGPAKLPAGSIVVGLITDDQEVLVKPYCVGTQHKNWDETLEKARESLYS